MTLGLILLPAVFLLIYLMKEKKEKLVFNEHLDVQQVIHPIIEINQLEKNIPNRQSYYLVREEWPSPNGLIDTMNMAFVGNDYKPLIIFCKDDLEECKKEAKDFYAKRQYEIGLRKQIYHGLKNRLFTLTLAFVQHTENLDEKEIIIEVCNEENLPRHEHYKNALKTVLEKPSLPNNRPD